MGEKINFLAKKESRKRRAYLGWVTSAEGLSVEAFEHDHTGGGGIQGGFERRLSKKGKAPLRPWNKNSIKREGGEALREGPGNTFS